MRIFPKNENFLLIIKIYICYNHLISIVFTGIKYYLYRFFFIILVLCAYPRISVNLLDMILILEYQTDGSVVVGGLPRVAELALGSVSLVTLLSFCFLALSTLYISLARTPTHRDKKHSYSKKTRIRENTHRRQRMYNNPDYKICPTT